MEKLPHPEGQSTERQEPASQELAQSWLALRKAGIETQIQEALAKPHPRSTETYKPKYPTEIGEPGSMEAGDYHVAKLEYEEELFGGGEDATDDGTPLEKLQKEARDLSDMKRRVETGDEELIETLAARELERRQGARS